MRKMMPLGVPAGAVMPTQLRMGGSKPASFKVGARKLAQLNGQSGQRGRPWLRPWLEKDHAAMLEEGLLSTHQPRFDSIMAACAHLQNLINR